MSHIDCPHCGARNVPRHASTELDRCRDCGRSLAAESELEEIRARVARAHRAIARSTRSAANGSSASRINQTKVDEA
jgi:hypothetical protein